MGKTFKSYCFCFVKQRLGHSGGERKSVFYACLSGAYYFMFFLRKCLQLRFWNPAWALGGIHEITFSMFFWLWTAWGPRWLPDLSPELPGSFQAHILEPTCYDLKPIGVENQRKSDLNEARWREGRRRVASCINFVDFLFIFFIFQHLPVP